MNNYDEQSNLPVLKEDNDGYLPVPVVDPTRRQKRAYPENYPDWSNITSQRWIRDLILDPNNEDIWLATDGGILHWQCISDSFTRYTSEHGLEGNAVRSLAMIPNGVIWAAHEISGLSYFQNGGWHYSPFFHNTQVLCLGTSGTDTLWVATANSFHAIVHPNEEPVLHELPQGLAPRKMIVANDGAVWICNAWGIHRYVQGRWDTYATFPDILTLAVTDNYLWLGRLTGLLCLDWQNREVHEHVEWPQDEITAIAPAAKGVWVASWKEFGQANIEKWSPYPERDALTGTSTDEDILDLRELTNVRVTCLADGGSGTVWIGTHDGLLLGDAHSFSFRLTHLPPDVVEDVSLPLATLSNTVQTLALQSTQNGPLIWIGTPRGLFRLEWQSERWKILFASQDIRALVVHNPQEEVWAACWPDGLQSAHLTKGRRYTKPSLRFVRILLKGIGSVYWAVNMEGVFIHTDDKWELLLRTEDLPGTGWIRAIAQTDAQQIWLALPGGLFHYHVETKDLSSVNHPFPGQTILTLLAPQEKKASEKLWIGTDRGLYRMQEDGTIMQTLDVVDQMVTALCWDSSAGMLWVGTNQGLFGLKRGKDIWSVTDLFQRRNSGLGADQITALAYYAEASAQKTLWIGTSCGLSCYRYT
jgi:ligand-binding sensor domain-containing protein